MWHLFIPSTLIQVRLFVGSYPTPPTKNILNQGSSVKSRVGGWSNPFETYARENGWESSPIFRVKQKNMWHHHLKLEVSLQAWQAKGTFPMPPPLIRTSGSQDHPCLICLPFGRFFQQKSASSPFHHPHQWCIFLEPLLDLGDEPGTFTF